MITNPVVNWAWSQNLNLASKMILLALAFKYADKDYRCIVSVPQLANDAAQTERSVQKSINTLEKLGLLKREQRKAGNGGNLSNVYTLLIDI
jgi:predicted transcriptional regulator